MVPVIRREFFGFLFPARTARLARGILSGFGGIAQLEEHLLCKQGVRGSSPLASTNNFYLITSNFGRRKNR